jgi:hypothetical protein
MLTSGFKTSGAELFRHNSSRTCAKLIRAGA